MKNKTLVENKIKEEYKYILAGNFQEFIRYCQDNYLIPKQKGGNAIYVDRPEMLRGIRCSKNQLIKYGTYYERKDRYEIEDLMDRIHE